MQQQHKPQAPALQPSHADEGWLGEQLRLLWRRRNFIAVVFGAVVAVVMIWSLATRPVYRATAKLLIERENPKVLSFKDVTDADSGRDDYYQTQYKLLQSRAVIRRVLEEVGDVFQQPEFGGPRAAAAIETARSAAPGQSILMEETIDAFLTHLRVDPEKNSRLVNVSFDLHAPELAARVVNALSRLYIEQTLEFRYRTSSEAGQWLGGQILEQRKKVEEAEVALQRLREQEGIVNVEERRALLEQKLKELGTASTALKTQRLEKEVLYSQMKSTPNPEDLPEVMKNPVIQALRIELSSLGRKEAQLLERYLDQHPEVLQVRKQVEETRARIATEAARIVQAAESDYKTTLAQEQSITTALEAAKAEALELSRRSIQYDSHKRELDAAKAVLDSVLSRAKETDVTQELRASNIRIVDVATPPREPIRPRWRQDLLLGILMGLGVGIGLALFLDHLDSTVKTTEDIRQYVGTPLLGVIPEAEGSQTARELILDAGAQGGSLYEGYRVLRTAINYCWSEPSSRLILVTSTIPGEGKTLTSVNVARSLAAVDPSVLLVDCDLRKPQIHSLLDLPRAPGFSDLLVGKAELAECLQRLPGTSCHLITAGTPVPSPADLMTSDALKRLVERLKGSYDWVVLDTPPVGAVADPLILAPVADGVLFVAAAEIVSRGAAREAVHRLASTGVRVLGAVLNRARRDQQSYYHYYGYYGRSQEEVGSSGRPRVS